MIKKWTGFALALLLCLSVAVSASAGVTVPFIDEEANCILYFQDDAGNRTAWVKEDGYNRTLMWVGTVEDAALGTAYLWSDSSLEYGLELRSKTALLPYTGDLKLTPPLTAPS